jgi:hypothetical protein
MIDQASTNITLLWVPSHVGIPGNEATDDAAKEALVEETHHTETYPPQDLIAWIKEKHEQEQQEKWENSTTTMKERKPHHIMNTNTKTMARREQVGISLLRIVYTRATHSAVMDKEPSPECPFCAVNLITDHILWQCKETETKRPQTGITKEIWKGGRQEMEKLIKYVKEIELFDGILKKKIMNSKIICRKKNRML